LAIAQIVSATNAIRALMPPGVQPPIVVAFNASSVPILQLSLSSDNLSEQQLYDYGIYRVRQQLAPVPGVTLPTPAGGKYRQIMVDLDPAKLVSRGLTPLDVVNGVRTALKTLRAAAPAGLRIGELFDQSVFVTQSVEGVLREGAIAAGLTALMILLFLGSWRSTLVVMISIP